MIRSAIIIAAFAASGAGEGDLGATYPIVEPDALIEMERSAAGKSVSLSDFGDSDRWTATRSRLLPVAERDRIRDVIPFFTLPFDIPDKDGAILYPKGFTFNPLEHLKLPNVLWIARPEQLDWVTSQAGSGDMVILSGGNALKESEGRDVPVFMLQDQLADRLSLEAAPARVWQEGAVLKVEEFAASRLQRAAPAKKAQEEDATGGGGR